MLEYLIRRPVDRHARRVDDDRVVGYFERPDRAGEILVVSFFQFRLKAVVIDLFAFFPEFRDPPAGALLEIGVEIKFIRSLGEHHGPHVAAFDDDALARADLPLPADHDLPHAAGARDVKGLVGHLRGTDGIAHVLAVQEDFRAAVMVLHPDPRPAGQIDQPRRVL